MSKFLSLALCIFAISYMVEGSPTRIKRFSDIVDWADNNELGEGNDEVERDERDATTFPPFPDHAQWWWGDATDKPEDDDSEVIVNTEKPSSTTPYRWTYETKDETTTPEYRYNEIEAQLEKGREHFHKKIVPWVRRQWGHARNFFKTHYDNIAG